MTLKEKFSLILMQFWASDWESQCEQVADEFAIGFAEWISKNDLYDEILLQVSEAKELLEMYKTEKGL